MIQLRKLRERTKESDVQAILLTNGLSLDGDMPEDYSPLELNKLNTQLHRLGMRMCDKCNCITDLFYFSLNKGDLTYLCDDCVDASKRTSWLNTVLKPVIKIEPLNQSIRGTKMTNFKIKHEQISPTKLNLTIDYIPVESIYDEENVKLIMEQHASMLVVVNDLLEIRTKFQSTMDFGLVTTLMKKIAELEELTREELAKED